jgi:hypothetical protein
MQSRMMTRCGSKGGLVTARTEKQREDLRRMEEERREGTRRANEEQRKDGQHICGVFLSLLTLVT